MSNPAIAGTILRNFSIAAVVGVSGVFAVDQIITIASRNQRAVAGREDLGTYNAIVHPEQDRLYEPTHPIFSSLTGYNENG